MTLIDTIELYQLSKVKNNKEKDDNIDPPKSISFNHFINFLYHQYNNENIKKSYFTHYDKLCTNIINPLNVSFINQKENLNFQLDFEKITNTRSFSFRIINLINQIDIKIDKKILLISDYSEFINRFSKIYERYNIESIIYNSKNKKYIGIDDKINILKKTLKKLIFLNDNLKLKNFLDTINELEIEKVDEIIIKHEEELCNNYLKYFIITKLPTFLISLTIAFNRLSKNGNLYLFLRYGMINNAFKKIIGLLVNSFNKVELVHGEGTGYLIKCKNYKENIDTKTLSKLKEIAIQSKINCYDICQFFNYFYFIEKKYPDNDFLYNLDKKTIAYLTSQKFKSYQTIMEVVNDIDLPFLDSQESKFIIQLINKLYNDYNQQLRYDILQYSKIEKDKLIIDYKYIINVNYNKLLNLINYYESNKLPYNKAYLTYINKFNKNLLNQLFTYNYSTNQKIVKYNQKSPSFNKINILKESYYYDEFNTQYDLWTLSYKVKLNLLEKLKTDDTPKIIKQVSEGFARGVSSYIMQKFNLEHKVSNAFCKLWEIYNSIKGILPMKANPKVFFMAEAPGQWIYCTNIYYYNNYIKKIKPYIKKSYKSYSYSSILKKTIKKNKSKKDYNDNKNGLEWIANSLNPNNANNIKKYGKDIFNDQYGFMKKYPKQWIFGVDDTGDFTITENQRWYRQYIKEFGKLDLITGDAGIFSDNPSIFQKLELAQVCMVAGLLSKGGNCVIKHFLPYVRKVPSTYYATGLFVNYMYLYYLMFDELHLIKPLTSNPDSGEFYVVGKGFKGISDQDYEILLKLLDNFQPNMCFFEKDDIDDIFVRQIVEFAEKIIKMNVDHNEITNLLMTCMIENDEIIEKYTNCSKFLNKTYIDKIFSVKYHEWVVNNNFK